MKQSSLTFLDLFAGIGGFRLGMEKAGHKCIGFCEINPYARQSYKSIHETEGEIEIHDITTISDEFIRGIGCVDVLTGGFPCQAFSIAGGRKGFKDIRGTLFFEIARFASILRPRYLFLENVKGLINHERGATFETILRTLDELGYDVEWQLLNSKIHVSQNRERVYIVGHLRGECTKKIFPIGRKKSTTSNQSNKKIITVGELDGAFRSTSSIYSTKGISPTLTVGGESPKILVKEATSKGYSVACIGDSIDFSFPNSKHRRGRVGKQQAHTLVTSNHQTVITNNFELRYLTPLECWRLQDFPDWAFLTAKFGDRKIAETILKNKIDHYNCSYNQVVSDSQLYKQAGNSVTVSIIYEIAKRL